MEIAEAIRKQIEIKGADSLSDRQLSTALLMDLTLNNTIEVRRFTFLYDINAVQKYLAADSAPPSEKRKVIAQTVLQLQQAIGLTEQISQTIAGYLPEALQWHEVQTVTIDESHFPDTQFRKFISDKYDKKNKGILSGEDLASITYMDVSVLGIKGNLKGIEYFYNLEILDCSSNDLTELNLSSNTNLKELYCSYNEHLHKLNTDGCSQLTKIDSACCPIEKEDDSFSESSDVVISDTIPLNEMTFPDEHFRKYIADHYDTDHDSQLSQAELDQVRYLDLSVREISGNLKGIEYFTKLEILDCSNNDLTGIDLSFNRELAELYCSFNPRLSMINVTCCSKLVKVDIEGTEIQKDIFSKNVQFISY